MLNSVAFYVPFVILGIADTFSNQKYLNVETYKRNGEGVRTPVWFAEEGGRLYFHTSRKSWKVKRIRRNPQVRVAPCTLRGEPIDDWVAGRAERVQGDEEKRILKLINRRYGFAGRILFFFERLLGGERLVFSIALSPDGI